MTAAGSVMEGSCMTMRDALCNVGRLLATVALIVNAGSCARNRSDHERVRLSDTATLLDELLREPGQVITLPRSFNVVATEIEIDFSHLDHFSRIAAHGNRAVPLLRERLRPLGYLPSDSVASDDLDCHEREARLAPGRALIILKALADIGGDEAWNAISEFGEARPPTFENSSWLILWQYIQTRRAEAGEQSE